MRTQPDCVHVIQLYCHCFEDGLVALPFGDGTGSFEKLFKTAVNSAGISNVKFWILPSVTATVRNISSTGPAIVIFDTFS